MKTMLLSDFIIMRRNIIQLFLTCLIITVIIAVAMDGTLAVVGACFGAMVPLLYLFSVAGYDELNDWQSFRITLPATRANIMAGRYLGMLIVTIVSVLLGAAVSYILGAIAGDGSFLPGLTFAANPPEAIWGSALGGSSMALFMGAVILPFIAKMGLTKSTRYVPVAFVIILLIVFSAFGEGGPLAEYLPSTMQWLLTSESATMVLIAGAGAVSLVCFGISLLVAIKIYEKREF